MQVNLFDLLPEAQRRRWAAPAGRDLLRLRDLSATVRPVFDPGAPEAARQQQRATSLEFLARHHYLQQATDAKAPLMTWTFGLYLNGTLSGMVVCNPPAAGVTQWLYGQGTGHGWRRRVIGITRTVCTESAPFNSESFLVSAVVRLLPQLDHRFTVAVAHSDLGIIDPHGKTHVGQIYMASNAFWAGHSDGGGWHFYNPETGAVQSRKCGARNLTKADCPPGWVVRQSAPLTRFLWFMGAEESAARVALQESVQVAIQSGGVPIWRRPAQVDRHPRRAYSAADKRLRLG